MTKTVHTLEECPQAPVIGKLEESLERLDRSSERTAAALERIVEQGASALKEIAEQGAMVMNHEKRLDSQAKDIEASFALTRSLENRIRPIELKHAQDEGESEIESRTTKFWTDVKIQLIAPILIALWALLKLCDHFGIFEKLDGLIK